MTNLMNVLKLKNDLGFVDMKPGKRYEIYNDWKRNARVEKDELKEWVNNYLIAEEEQQASRGDESFITD